MTTCHGNYTKFTRLLLGSLGCSALLATGFPSPSSGQTHVSSTNHDSACRNGAREIENGVIVPYRARSVVRFAFIDFVLLVGQSTRFAYAWPAYLRPFFSTYAMQSLSFTVPSHRLWSTV